MSVAGEVELHRFLLIGKETTSVSFKSCSRKGANGCWLCTAFSSTGIRAPGVLSIISNRSEKLLIGECCMPKVLKRKLRKHLEKEMCSG